jgi:uncharacterized protein YbjT (DUF2867 family)
VHVDSERKTFAVVGATGSVGRAVAQRLRGQGHHVRGIARSLGVSFDDVGALRRAFTSVDGAFVMVPFDLRAPDLHKREDEIGSNIAGALAAARVRRVVFLSGTSAHLRERAGSATGAAMMEERLDRLGIPELLHLRGAFFMENMLQGVRQIAATGVFAWAFRPDRATPMVAAADVGERAAALLMAPSFDELDRGGEPFRFHEAAALLTAPSFADPRVREVLGPRDYTLDEATRILGEAIGRPDIRYAQLPYDEARRAMIDAGLSASFADAVMDTARSFNEGQVWATEPRSPRNTSPTILEEFAASVFAPAYEALAPAGASAAGVHEPRLIVRQSVTRAGD